MMRHFGAVQLAGLTDLTGGIILLLASLLVEPGAWASMSFHWGWASFLAWLYLLIPGSLISTTMYFFLVRDWGASKPGLYAFISPVIAVVVGASLFGEQLNWGDAVGMALMLAAAGLSLRRGGAARVIIEKPTGFHAPEHQDKPVERFRTDVDGASDK
jgi:drug/metabolite transporter (DMT)-like permease